MPTPDISNDGVITDTAAPPGPPAAFSMFGISGAFSGLGCSTLLRLVSTSESWRNGEKSTLTACFTVAKLWWPVTAAHNAKKTTPVTTIARTKAIGSLIAGFITWSPSAAGRNVSGYRYILDASLTGLVHDLCNSSRRSQLVGDDDDGVLRPFDVQAFD